MISQFDDPAAFNMFNIMKHLHEDGSIRDDLGFMIHMISVSTIRFISSIIWSSNFLNSTSISMRCIEGINKSLFLGAI